MWTNILLSVLVIILIIFAVYFCCCVSAALIRFILEPTIALCNCTTRLDGKTALVTGGNSGIGFETAKDLAKRGARVIIADINNAETAVANIIQSTDNPNVQYMHIDLSKFSNIRLFADKFNKTVDQLDILVNNAGCLLIKKFTTDDGMDLTMQVNYLGPFLMTKLIMEKLLKSPQCRIVNVTSAVYIIGSVDFEDLSGSREW
ncbi:retinol dehydrogenase 13-like [Leptidea sinapis]|uniref:retinol dehydrogenase 13-like n=1 Tax=Leptidea sinapis TaxID=189913 RepID=UPI0021C40B96|nr:retinol dehydrogenase 13-like [Leptidea sinapis]